MSGEPMRRLQLAELLIDLEAALRNAALWESAAPEPARLASTQPFCIDTLEFNQWLQFVFLPRMGALLEHGQPLPGKCAIAAMAEVWLAGRAQRGDTLLAVLRRIDAVVEHESGRG